ncbi:BMP family ABC transporter substrate-binding protein [Jannaschia sp. LMIT008]|uniref:BMP family ABC transporter substrate-binding protein n=1 Tax=Jannaschia maritima TaxID=3032585 RepID=UPI0028112F1D|nr:BMP family ABC transporter substrate-binding protein [Jannaschia sp. LMIT008]
MDRRTFLAASAGLMTPRIASATTETATVGLLLVGPKTDGGWSQHHHESMQEAIDRFDGRVDMMVQESVPEGADAERALTQMALRGADLIFAASFGYMDPTIAVASRFPDVRFEHATGFKTAPNVAVYNPRFYEGLAVMGHIAGRMTETKKIGIVAPYPIPLVFRGINSIFAHARQQAPDVEMNIVWINTWFDPAREADATRALLEQGADFVLSLTDSTAPLAAIEAHGTGWGFGFTSDMVEYAPYPRLSSVITNWTPYYAERIGALLDGTWTSGNRWDGLAHGMVLVGDFSDAMPPEVRESAGALAADIASGAVHPFTGPLRRQDGSVWLADGAVADDGSLAGMDFLLDGIASPMPR